MPNSGARLHDHDFWVKEAHRYREEADHLRAQVAALVKALKAMKNSHGMHGPCNKNGCATCRAAYDAAKTLLDSPDLAALVAREQAREALERAVRNYMCGGNGIALSKALAALDAVERQP